MKKNNKQNKIIILSLIGLIFTISLVIFILNYTKDDSSFSILEKKWISNHKSSVIDISVYNDVPIYGLDGEGLIFSYLEEFTNSYGIEFNKISYLTSSSSSLKDTSFRILDTNAKLGENDIELFKDYYVIVSKNNKTINDISDLKEISLGVLDNDIKNIRYYLNDGKDIKFVSCKSIDEMLNMFKSSEFEYMAIPSNQYLNIILENDLSIVYHISEVYKPYVITINNDKTFKNIMNKYNMIYKDNYEDNYYKKYFLNTFFKYKKITEAEKMNYNAQTYVYGFTTKMPYENLINKEFVGTIANYIGEFEDLTGIDFKMVEYNSNAELKQALSHGEIDLLFSNFNIAGVNVDTFTTGSPFKEEYVIISQEPILVNSIRSLKEYEIYTVLNTYLYDYLQANEIKCQAYDNTDLLLRNIRSDSIIMVDKDTYEYYKDNKFKNYKKIYEDTLENDYSFVIRDVNKNETFYKLFNYFVSSINYKTIKYDYNTEYVVSSKEQVKNIIKYLIATLVFITIIVITTITFIKRRNKKKDIKKEDKFKYIDTMTSLKNRNYLNYNIRKWDENIIYPQSIVIIDLNNIKYINDNYGHEEGDEVIKKAASILINNQQEHTDIVRTDGNEFLIYMVGFDEKSVIDYTRKISKELKELPHGFGATLGYSMIEDDIKTIDDAINEATLSMRQAKEKL